MSDFSGMEELLQDFLQEASELLADVDNKLVDLEKEPGDRGLLNDVFRGFHTIKGGAGFLNIGPLVTLCHLTENLFDRLRNGELALTPEIMDVILSATAAVREMFEPLSQGAMPEEAEPALLEALQAAMAGAGSPAAAGGDAKPTLEPDWDALYQAVAGPEKAQGDSSPLSKGERGNSPAAPWGRRASDHPDVDVARSGRRESDKLVVAKESSIRVDTDRLDYVLTLSGEIGLTKNRLTSLRNDVLKGKTDAATLRALDEAVNQLDLMVGNLQNAVMKTRMQPIGRLFRKYPRLARDLARQLGKDVELVLYGEETEIDKTMIEDLNDPLVHLVRNAVDHGVEDPAERAASGKPAKSEIVLSARQEGDHIVIEISDDGRGIKPEAIRAKALEKGLITLDEANGLDDRQSLNLIFLPGFSTKDQVSNVSGRGVGMDVVKTNIEKLNGTIAVHSEPGKGSRFVISLPLTLAILPVLVVKLGEQPFALPLSMVREILPIEDEALKRVGGKPTMVVRGEVLPVVSLASLIEWTDAGADLSECTTRAGQVGVLVCLGETVFVLAVDSFVGRDDVVIKSLESFRPRGVAGATMSSEGEIVLILDLAELVGEPREKPAAVSRPAAPVALAA